MSVLLPLPAGTVTAGEIYRYQEITEKNGENAGQKEKQKQPQQQYYELQKTMFLKKPISNGDLVKEVNKIRNVN